MAVWRSPGQSSRAFPTRPEKSCWRKIWRTEVPPTLRRSLKETTSKMGAGRMITSRGARLCAHSRDCQVKKGARPCAPTTGCKIVPNWNVKPGPPSHLSFRRFRPAARPHDRTTARKNEKTNQAVARRPCPPTLFNLNFLK